jgi:hypothetical protein
MHTALGAQGSAPERSRSCTAEIWPPLTARWSAVLPACRQRNVHAYNIPHEVSLAAARSRVAVAAEPAAQANPVL